MRQGEIDEHFSFRHSTFVFNQIDQSADLMILEDSTGQAQIQNCSRVQHAWSMKEGTTHWGLTTEKSGVIYTKFDRIFITFCFTRQENDEYREISFQTGPTFLSKLKKLQRLSSSILVID